MPTGAVQHRWTKGHAIRGRWGCRVCSIPLEREHGFALRALERIHRFAPGTRIGQTTCSVGVGTDEVRTGPIHGAEYARHELPLSVREVEGIADVGLHVPGNGGETGYGNAHGAGEPASHGKVSLEPNVAVAVTYGDTQVGTQVIFGVLGDEHPVHAAVGSGVS